MVIITWSKSEFYTKGGVLRGFPPDNGLGQNSVLVQLIQMPSVPCMIAQWSTLVGGIGGKPLYKRKNKFNIKPDWNEHVAI